MSKVLLQKEAWDYYLKKEKKKRRKKDEKKDKDENKDNPCSHKNIRSFNKDRDMFQGA